MKKSQYIVGPKPDEKLINLHSVTNIAFEEYTDRNGLDAYKVIMNFDYGVSLKNDFDKQISDYAYFVMNDESQFIEYKEMLNTLVNENGWIAPIVNGEIKRIFNPDKISFVATDKRKNRIIFNIATSVSFYNNVKRKSSDFAYIDFDTPEDFEAEYNYIKDQLENREY
jgi:hypothetical protein